MASSEHASTLSHERIRANGQERGRADTPDPPPEEETTVASRAGDAERILPEPVKVGGKRRRKRWSRETIQVALLGTIGIGGIAAILWLRYLAETFGVN